eukprot:ctg_2795.g556
MRGCSGVGFVAVAAGGGGRSRRLSAGGRAGVNRALRPNGSLGWSSSPSARSVQCDRGRCASGAAGCPVTLRWACGGRSAFLGGVPRAASIHLRRPARRRKAPCGTSVTRFRWRASFDDPGAAFALRDALALLAATVVTIPIFKKMRLSPILGFLLAGVVLGPHGTGAVAGAAVEVAQTGVRLRDVADGPDHGGARPGRVLCGRSSGDLAGGHGDRRRAVVVVVGVCVATAAGARRAEHARRAGHVWGVAVSGFGGGAAAGAAAAAGGYQCGGGARDGHRRHHAGGGSAERATRLDAAESAGRPGRHRFRRRHAVAFRVRSGERGQVVGGVHRHGVVDGAGHGVCHRPPRPLDDAGRVHLRGAAVGEQLPQRDIRGCGAVSRHAVGALLYHHRHVGRLERSERAAGAGAGPDRHADRHQGAHRHGGRATVHGVVAGGGSRGSAAGAGR